MTEAMYYYTPIITTPYEEFTETYGSTIDFGYYINTNEELVNTIGLLFNTSTDAYLQLMECAHHKVKDFSWNAYITQILNKITE